jgi:hypothetical protein
VLTGGPTSEERDERLAGGADDLASGPRRGSLLGNDRILLAVAGGLMTFGLCAVLLGWYGASRSTLVEEQVPYLISGGLLGVALATVGAITFFAHWLTVSIREARAREAARHHDHIELMGALQALANRIDHQEASGNGSARRTTAERPLRRAPRSS